MGQKSPTRCNIIWNLWLIGVCNVNSSENGILGTSIIRGTHLLATNKRELAERNDGSREVEISFRNLRWFDINVVKSISATQIHISLQSSRQEIGLASCVGMSLRKALTATAALSTTLYAGSVALERRPGLLDPNTPAGNAASGAIAFVRFTRALRTAAVVMADYRMLFARHTEYTSQDYKEERSIVHSRCAKRLLELCKTQGAVYVKIGQHVASMNHAVPPEYWSTLKLLEDRAAYRPFPQIKRMIQRELKRPLKDVFEKIEEVPVAAASLAQVHRAWLKDTHEKVAIKVQYPGLSSLVAGDLTSIRMLSWLLSWVFPFFTMGWVVDQFRKNLEKELDFILEAESAERTGRFFEADSHVFVPDVHKQFSTSKILTMEYIDGFRVDDLESLEREGIDKHKVAQTVVDAFAQMIFVNGFVHCDSHGGNIMIRPRGKNDFDLFLLDHGLYRELNDTFRQSYCKLWKGLVLRNTGEVESACAELGAPGFANIFSVMLLNRSWTSAKRVGTDIRMKMTQEEIQRLKKDLRDGGIRSQADVSTFLENIPDDLLLVFKMNSLVRNVNKALGASVNRFKVNARYAVKGLRHWNGDAQQNGHTFSEGVTVVAGTHSESCSQRCLVERLAAVRNWFGLMFDTVCVELNLLILDAALIAVRWWLGGGVIMEMGTNASKSDDVKLLG